MKKRYRIFDYIWHVPHQFDMIYALREDCDFYLCLNAKKQWDSGSRPVPQNLTFVTHYEPGFYDLAILHIDQQIIVQDHIKKLIYDQFDSLIQDIPKIVLNHGTPVFPERFYELGLHRLTEKQMELQCIAMVKDIVGTKTMVVNSHTAATGSEWGFGMPIVHGMNPADWLDLPKEPRAFTALAPYGFNRYYNRSTMIEVSDILFRKSGQTLSFAKINIDTHRSPDDYRNYLGRSLIYVDTSFRTPMNRARTEAFLSGCCVVQVEGAHDLERWATDGENIVLVPDNPSVIADTIIELIEHRYQDAVEIGKKAKEMAIMEFSPERYRDDWMNLLKQEIK